MSDDTIRVLFCFCCDILIKFKSLHMLSEARLVLMNPVWSGWISIGVTVSILVASVLVIIFKSVLINERGQ